MSTVCTSTLCKTGRAAVVKMAWTWDYLLANNEAFDAASFETPVRAVQASLAEVDSWYVDLVPFNTTCCTIESIGIQADQLTNQMLLSVGSVGVPPPPKETDWVTVAMVGGALLLLVVYSPQIKKALR